jgi:hypothetical protein
MVYKVVSTKLTEEEHTKFLEFCNKKGISPFAVMKEAIDDMISEEEPNLISLDELRRELRMR